MKLDTGEESGSSTPPGTSHIMTESTEKRGLKREYHSDEEDTRPIKIPKEREQTEEKTACKNEIDEYNVIETPTLEAAKKSPSHSLCKAGCSKDSDLTFPKPMSVKVTETYAVEKQDDTDEEEETTLPVELMSLSDDVLLMIMSYLKPTDLFNLSQCCQRLFQVASDWSLWVNVDFRPHSLLEEKLQRFLPFLSETTESIATRGFVASKPRPRWCTECLSSEFLQAVGEGCPCLRSFVAEEHCINANKVKISAFPSSLEHLSLKKCEIVNLPKDYSYFNNVYRFLPNLRVLELSDCTWLPAHSIMALSKLPCLEDLFLDGCHLIKDCIAYASLAFNLGFSKLKVLDLRRTGVSDSELSSLNRSNRLTHLYLEYPRNNGFENDEDPEVPRANHLPGIVSDLGLRSLVTSDKPHVLFNNAQFGINSEEIHVMAPVKDKVSLCKIHTLVARNFSLVTDATLHELHFAQSLRFLDLTGTQITRHGLEVFCASRPEVTVVSSFSEDLL